MLRRALVLLWGAGLTKAASYQDKVRRWRERRETALRAPYGWLSVAGLFWLREGSNPLGSDPSNSVVLPRGAAPAHAGEFVLRDGKITVQTPSGTRTLRPDTGDFVAFGAVRLSLIHRGGRYGIRMRDPQSQYRREFSGLRWFPVNSAWRIVARFVWQPRKIPILNVLGQTEPQDCPGYAEFTLAGRKLRLYPVREPGAQELFFIFRDLTSGKETYGAGRFLDAPLPVDQQVILDFNQAYSPPCAFTPYATCPLPPAENRLPVRMAAGEMQYGSH